MTLYAKHLETFGYDRKTKPEDMKFDKIRYEGDKDFLTKAEKKDI